MAAAEAYDPSSKKRKAGNEELVEIDLDVATSLIFGKKEVAGGSPGDVMVTRLSPTHTIEWIASGGGQFKYTIRNAKGQKDSLNDFPAEKIWMFGPGTKASVTEIWFSNDAESRDPSLGPASADLERFSDGTLEITLSFMKNGKNVVPTESLLRKLTSAEYGQSLVAKYPGVANITLYLGDDWNVYWEDTHAGFDMRTQHEGDEIAFSDYIPSRKIFGLAWNLFSEEWKNAWGRPHRSLFVGPAIIHYNVDGTVNREMFFQNGRRISERDVARSLFRK